MTRRQRKSRPGQASRRPQPAVHGKRQELRELMQSHMRTMSIEMLMADDGAPASDLLAGLGWLLAVAAELSARTQPGSQLAKTTHAALRTVLDLCQRGNRWQASQSLVLQRAFDVAFELLDADHAGARSCMDGANWIGHRISIGIATPADVAGAEIYTAQPAQPQPEVSHA